VYTNRMTWQEIRELHPQQWLLLEVLEAESDTQTRYLKNLAVLERFDNSMTALRAYRDLKKSHRIGNCWFYTPTASSQPFKNAITLAFEAQLEFVRSTTAVVHNRTTRAFWAKPCFRQGFGGYRFGSDTVPN
jgi:hypothetical protein